MYMAQPRGGGIPEGRAEVEGLTGATIYLKMPGHVKQKTTSVRRRFGEI